MSHREPRYATLQNEVRRRVLDVYDGCGLDYDAVLIAGSGTAAVEAMLASIVPISGRVLVVANGVYGERAASVLSRIARAHEIVKASWVSAIDLDAVERRLERTTETPITHVVAVHHETTSGRLNDIKSLNEICSGADVKLLLDCVSSFGGEEIDFSGWNLAGLAATANKCLQGVPGVAFVIARKADLADAANRAPSVYLDLHTQWETQREGGVTFTPPVQVVAALRQALIELEGEGGWEARRDRFRRLSTTIRHGLRVLGVNQLLKDSDLVSGATLTSFVIPGRLKFSDLAGALRSHGFVVYGAQGHLEATTFRVAVMGEVRDSDVKVFVSSIAAIIAEFKEKGLVD